MIAHSLTTEHIGDPITSSPPDGKSVFTVTTKKTPTRPAVCEVWLRPGCSQPLLRNPRCLEGVRWKSNRSVNDNLTLHDRSTHCRRSPLEPLPSCNQALCEVLLFGSTGGAVHNAHGQWRHSCVEPSQLGQQLAIFPDHRASP